MLSSGPDAHPRLHLVVREMRRNPRSASPAGCHDLAVRHAKERLMFGARGSNAPTTWKHIENDFVMGACAHQLFGYITRSPSDEWTALDSDSRPIGHFTPLDAAKTALWTTHQPTHHKQCTSRINRWWNRPSRQAPTPSAMALSGGVSR